MSSSNQDSGDIAGALGAYETAPAIMLACEGDEMVLASANEAARAALGDHFELGRPVRELAPHVVDQLTNVLDDDVGHRLRDRPVRDQAGLPRRGT